MGTSGKNKGSKRALTPTWVDDPSPTTSPTPPPAAPAPKSITARPTKQSDAISPTPHTSRAATGVAPLTPVHSRRVSECC